MVSKEYKSYIETAKGTIEQTPDNYGHYHLSMVDNTTAWIELTVFQVGDKHKVEETWGDHGEEDAIIGEFNSLMEALIFAYGFLLRKHPNAQFCNGAGCPPNDLIDLVKKELNYKESE